MDQYEEIPNYIFLHEGDNVTKLYMPQMQRSFSLFLEKIQDLRINWNSVIFYYEDEKEEMKMMRSKEDYDDAITNINGQRFCLKAVVRNPNLHVQAHAPPSPSPQPQLQPAPRPALSGNAKKPWICRTCCYRNTAGTEVCGLCGDK